jgi:hypothetical protein
LSLFINLLQYTSGYEKNVEKIWIVEEKKGNNWAFEKLEAGHKWSTLPTDQLGPLTNSAHTSLA